MCLCFLLLLCPETTDQWLYRPINGPITLQCATEMDQSPYLLSFPFLSFPSFLSSFVPANTHDGERVRARHNSPNQQCFASAITACARGIDPRAALELLRNMREDDIAPNEVVLNAAVDACGKVRWEKTKNCKTITDKQTKNAHTHWISQTAGSRWGCLRR